MQANHGDGDPADNYSYRASLVGGAHAFTLADDGLHWQVGARAGVWPYQDIVSVALSYRPVSMQARRFRADIGHRSGARLTVISASWQTVTLMAPQDEAYRAFILRLHARLAATGRPVLGRSGLRAPLYWTAVVILAIIGVAMAGLAARAVAMRQWSGLAFVAGFAALFGWQIGGFMKRNQPRLYPINDPPRDLLP